MTKQDEFVVSIILGIILVIVLFGFFNYGV